MQLASTALTLLWVLDPFGNMATTAILLVSPFILRLFGKKGTQALERLMGLLLILIAVQMFLDGILPQ